MNYATEHFLKLDVLPQQIQFRSEVGKYKSLTANGKLFEFEYSNIFSVAKKSIGKDFIKMNSD